MFHGFKKTKGVISIFLVIILVPMLTASSLFVDISKMVLAHSVAESAADLSLNTVMTHFDKKLNEYYGLSPRLRAWMMHMTQLKISLSPV